MFINESDNESLFPREESPNPIFDFYEIQEPKSMNYENDEKSKNSEIENNNEYISKDITTAITKEKTNNNLGNKRKRYEEDKEIKDLNEIKKIPNIFEEGKKNEDLIKDETYNKTFEKKKK